MKTSVRAVDGVTVIEFEGEIDTNTSIEAEALFAKLIGQGKKQIVANFSKLDYITSAGISVLIKAEKQLKSKNGDIAFCCFNHNIQDVFHIAGITYRYNIFSKESEALDFFGVTI